MEQKITAKELIEKLAKEIGRLQKLCKDNGIDYKPKMGPNAAIKLEAKVTVFKTTEEAEEYKKTLNIS